METFYKTHAYLVEHTNAAIRRDLMDKVDWNDRLIGIKGTRGVGKTTFLLQCAKEKFGGDRSCLYINMNNLFFSSHSLADFALDFTGRGGKTLLIDQIFKHPDYSRELRLCYDRFPGLKIVFAGSSVMNINSKEENPEIWDIAKTYNLHGFSFREFMNLRTDMKFRAYTLDELLSNHEQISRAIMAKANPMEHFDDYIHHGFYPFYMEKHSFSEDLLKTMNMMIEVDILLIKQIELKYLPKIKKLLYLLAIGGAKAPNVSQLAAEIQTSRATVMNYIQYLQEARLINTVYPQDGNIPKKPSRVLMHNTNLMYSMYPVKVEEQDVIETFFVNNLYGRNQISKGDKYSTFVINNSVPVKLCNSGAAVKKRDGVTYIRRDAAIGRGRDIPLWLFGFLH